MSDEQFNIRFNEQGAAQVVQSMRDVVSSATNAAEATENLQEQLTRTRNAANPAQRAYEGLAAGIDTLGRAQRANLITAGEEQRLRSNLIAITERQVRPIASLIGGIEAETRAWRASTTERQAAIRTMSQLQALQRRGVVASAEEREAITRANVAYVQQREELGRLQAAERERARVSAQAARETEAAAQRASQAAVRAAEQAAREKARIATQERQQAERAEAQRNRLLFSASRGLAQGREREETQATRRAGIVGSFAPRTNAETEAYRLNTVERQANLRTIQQQEAARTAGVALTDSEVAGIRQANLAYAQQREALRLVEQTERQLASVRNIGGNRVQAAQAQYSNARGVVQRAGQIGLISSGEQAQLERNLTAAYAEQTSPIARANRLLAERAEYQRGLFASGSALAEVERAVTRAEEQGIAVSQRDITSLRARAREVDGVAKAYRSIQGAKSFVGNILGTLAIAGGAGELARSLDETTNVRNLVNVTSTGPNNQQDVTQAIYRTAEQTHSEVESTAKLYSRLELSAQRFGIGQQQVLNLTKEVNQQIRLSGTSQGESTRAVIDFAHTLGSGNVQFRELRALTQQAPFVSVQLAKGLTELAREGTKQGQAFAARAKAAGVDVGKRDISVGDFKELTSKRAIGSLDVFRGEELETQDTQRRFEKLTPTIAQATTDLKTFFLQYLDGANQSSGASKNIAGGIEFIAQNLDKIIPTALIAGSAIAGIFVVKETREFLDVIGVLANRIGLIGGGSKANSIAIDGNTGALDGNSTAAGANAREIDSVTAALARNTIARRANTGAASPVGTAVPVAGEVAEAEGAAATTGVAAAEGAGAAGLGIAGAFGVAVPLILAAVTAFALLKDSVEVSKKSILAYNDEGVAKAIQGNITLGDVVTGIFGAITSSSSDAASSQAKDASAVTSASVKADQDRLNSAKNAFARTGDYYDQLQNGLLRGTIKFVGMFILAADKIQAAFDTLAGGILVVMANAFQGIANKFIDLVNSTIVPGTNLLLKASGQGQLGQLSKVNIVAGADALNAKTKARDQATIDRDQRDILNRLAGAVIGTAARRQTLRPNSITNGEGTGDDGAGAKAKKAKKDPVETAYEELVKKAFPAIDAIHQFNEALEMLHKAAAKGYIQKTANEINRYDRDNHVNVAGTANGQITTAGVRSEIERQLREQTFDAVDPTRVFERNNKAKVDQLKFESQNNSDPFNRSVASSVFQELKSEADKLHQSVDEFRKSHPDAEGRIRKSAADTSTAEQNAKVSDALREENQQRALQVSQLGESEPLIRAQNDAYKIYKDQLLSGVAGAREAYAAQVQVNIAFEKYQEDVQRTKAVFDAIVGPQRAFNDEIVSLNNLLATGKINIAQYDEQVRHAQESLLEAPNSKVSFVAGFQKGLLEIKDESENTASDVAGIFKSSYNEIGDAFANLFSGERPQQLKQQARQLFASIAGDAAKALFHKATDPLISRIGKATGTPGFGDKALKAERADITATNVYVNGKPSDQQLGIKGVNPFGPNTQAPNGVAPFARGANDNAVNPFANIQLGQANGTNGLNLRSVNTRQLTPGLDLSASGLLGQSQTPASVVGSTPSLFSGIGGTSGIGNGLGSLSLLSGGTGSSASPVTPSGGGGILGGLGGLSGILGAVEKGAGGQVGGILKTAQGILGGGAGGGGIGGILHGLSGLLGGAGGGAGAAAGAAGGAGGIFSSLASLGSLFGFATGGSFNVGGNGGTDSQVVAFKATPGENVSVGTPDQLKAAHAAAESAGQAPTINQKIVNVIDPQAALDAMSTQAGFKTILNHIQSNPEAIKRALGS